jgi:DNA repair protein RecO (recombination protein O)
MVTTRVEAVVVRSDREGESDRLLTLYTRELGRVLAVARGADRPKNRWAGRARLFAHFQGDLYQRRRGGSRYTLTQGQLLHAHEGIQSSLARIGAASQICEMVSALTPLGVHQAPLWELLLESLTLLDQGRGEESIVPAFQMRFLEILGLAPHLSGCTVCNRPYTAHSAAYYSASKGGLVCRTCVPEVESPALLSRDAMRLFAALSRLPQRESVELSAKREAWREVNSVLRQHLEYHLDYQSRTAGWLTET